MRLLSFEGMADSPVVLLLSVVSLLVLLLPDNPLDRVLGKEWRVGGSDVTEWWEVWEGSEELIEE